MDEPTVNAATRWATGLAAWAIPAPILAAAPESPWGYPPQLYVDATHTAMTEDTPSRRAAAERFTHRWHGPRRGLRRRRGKLSLG